MSKVFADAHYWVAIINDQDQWVSKGDIHSFGKLDDSGKPALREPGILPQQLRASPLIPPPLIPL